MSRLVPWILPWLLAGHVPAALATDLPSLIDPGELTGVREGVVTSLERQQPASIELKDEEAAARPAPVSAHPIRHIKLFGGSVYPAGEIAAILRPLVGTRPTTAQLQDALNRITERYRKDGYPLCYAYSPSAPDASGTLQVYLVEGQVVRLEVEAEPPGLEAQVRDLAQVLLEEKPLRQSTFERQVALMQRIPGSTIRAQVPMPRTINGATTLRVIGERGRPLTGGASLDWREDGPRAMLNGTLRGLTRHAESLSVAALYGPGDNDEQYYALAYGQALNRDGLRLDLGAAHYASDAKEWAELPLDASRILYVRGHQQQDRFHAGVSYPLRLSRLEELSIGSRLEYIDKTTRYDRRLFSNGYGMQDVAPFETGLTSPSLNLSLAWRSQSARTLTTAQAEARRGLDALGAESDVPSYDLDYTRLHVGGRHVRQLGASWRLSVAADAYWSGDHLPDVVQASYGGFNFGRAYPDGQIKGDAGYAGEVEIRYIQPLPWAWMNRVQPYLVADAARTRYNGPGPDGRLASLAFGMEFGDGRHYALAVEYAHPLREIDIPGKTWNGQVNVRLSYQFG